MNAPYTHRQCFIKRHMYTDKMQLERLAPSQCQGRVAHVRVTPSETALLFKLFSLGDHRTAESDCFCLRKIGLVFGLLQ